MQAQQENYGLLRTHTIDVDISDLVHASAALGPSLQLTCLNPVDALCDAIVSARTADERLVFAVTAPTLSHRDKTLRVGGKLPSPPIRTAAGTPSSDTAHDKWMQHVQTAVCPLSCAEGWHDAQEQTVASGFASGTQVRGTTYHDGLVAQLWQQKAQAAGADYAMGIHMFVDACVTDVRGERSVTPVCVSTPVVQADSGANLSVNGRTVAYLTEYTPTNSSVSQRQDKYEVVQRQLKALLKLCSTPTPIKLFLPQSAQHQAQTLSILPHIATLAHDMSQAWVTLGLLGNSCAICSSREVSAGAADADGHAGRYLHCIATEWLKQAGKPHVTLADVLNSMKKYDLHACILLENFYSANGMDLTRLSSSIAAPPAPQPAIHVQDDGSWSVWAADQANEEAARTFFEPASRRRAFRSGELDSTAPWSEIKASGMVYNPQVLQWMSKHLGLPGGVGSAYDMLHSFDAGVLLHVFESIRQLIHDDSVLRVDATVADVEERLAAKVGKLNSQEQDAHSIRGGQKGPNQRRILGTHKRRGVEYRELLVWLAAIIQDGPSAIANRTQRARVYWLLSACLELQDMILQISTISWAQLSQIRERVAWLQTLYALTFPGQVYGKPKFHALTHIIDAFLFYGSPRNVTTAPLEKMHQLSCSAVWAHDNHRLDNVYIHSYVKLLVARSRVGSCIVIGSKNRNVPAEVMLAACMLVLLLLRRCADCYEWLPSIVAALNTFCRVGTQNQAVRDCVEEAGRWLKSNASPKLIVHPASAEPACAEGDVLQTAMELTGVAATVRKRLSRLEYRIAGQAAQGSAVVAPVSAVRWQDRYRQARCIRRGGFGLIGRVTEIQEASSAVLLHAVPAVTHEELAAALGRRASGHYHYFSAATNNEEVQLSCADYRGLNPEGNDLLCYISTAAAFPKERRLAVVLGFLTSSVTPCDARSDTVSGGGTQALCRIAQPAVAHKAGCSPFRYTSAAPSFVDAMFRPIEEKYTFKMNTAAYCIIPVHCIEGQCVYALHESNAADHVGTAQKLPGRSAFAHSIRVLARDNPPPNTTDRHKVNGRSRQQINQKTEFN